MKFRYIVLLVLSAALLVFAGCEQEPFRIDISLEADYSGMLAAVRGADKSLSDKMALIESAQTSGMASSEQALQLIQEAIASLNGTLEEKLDAIAEAMKAQTTALQTKLALLEAALQAGFADEAQAQELVRKALESLGGTVEQKLAAVEEAVKSPAAGLETKLSLVEAAVEQGFTEDAGRQELIKKALESLSGSVEEKLQAIEAAMSSRTTSLETKLGLISAALEKGLGDGTTAIGNLQKALDQSVTDLGSDFSEARDKMLLQLEAIAAQMAPEEFAKSFQGILNSLQDSSQTEQELLEKLQKAVNDLAEVKIKKTVFSVAPVWPANEIAVEKVWEKGDRVYLFFENIAAPKHLRMTYNGVAWTYREMDGNEESPGCLGLQSGDKGKVTAFCFPYAGEVGISASGANFILSDPDAAYLSASLTYTVSGGVFSCKPELHLPEGYVLLFVNIQNHSPYKHELREPHLIPQSITSIAADGSVKCTLAAHGAPLKGYTCSDESFKCSFGGVLAHQVRGVPTDYRFTVVDSYDGSAPMTVLSTSSILEATSFCTEDPTSHSRFLTVGRLKSSKTMDLACDIDMGNGEKKRIYWGNANLGASIAIPNSTLKGEALAEELRNNRGDYFAWGEKEPYYESGEGQEPAPSWKQGKSAGYAWDSYRFTQNGGTTMTRYNATDGLTVLLPEDDAASYDDNTWRTPTIAEWEALCDKTRFEWEWVDKLQGYYVRSLIPGYTADGRYIFIQAAHYREGTDLGTSGEGLYWSSTLDSNNPSAAKCFTFSAPDATSPFFTTEESRPRYVGASVRFVTD